MKDVKELKVKYIPEMRKKFLIFCEIKIDRKNYFNLKKCLSR